MEYRIFPPSPRVRPSAFTLVELLVSLGVLVIGGSFIYSFLAGDLGLYTRNFSINKSNNSLRHSLQSLKRDIDTAIEPPLLITATIDSKGVATLAPLTVASPQSAQAILAYVNYGPAYQLQPTVAGKSTLIDPTKPILINRYVASTANVTADPYAASSPLPVVGDRILFMSPGPYSDGMPEYVNLTTGKPVTAAVAGSTVIKPGRLITSVTPVIASGTPPSQFLITIDQTNPLRSGGNLVVKDNNSVYFFRESVYAVRSIGTTESQLVYYSSVSSLTNPKLIIRDLDPAPQEIDAITTKTIAPFNYYTRLGNSYPLTVNLPVRALDWANSIGERNLGGKATDTSSAEFNLYLRSSTTMNIKGRLDDTSLTEIKPN